MKARVVFVAYVDVFGVEERRLWRKCRWKKFFHLSCSLHVRVAMPHATVVLFRKMQRYSSVDVHYTALYTVWNFHFHYYLLFIELGSFLVCFSLYQPSSERKCSQSLLCETRNTIISFIIFVLQAQALPLCNSLRLVHVQSEQANISDISKGLRLHCWIGHQNRLIIDVCMCFWISAKFIIIANCQILLEPSQHLQFP